MRGGSGEAVLSRVTEGDFELKFALPRIPPWRVRGWVQGASRGRLLPNIGTPDWGLIINFLIIGKKELQNNSEKR
jgi:hypothetical protein